MQKRTLYEMTEDYETVLNMLYDPEVDEDVIFDTLEGIEGEIEDKADGYAKLIMELKADAQKIKDEEQRLYARRISIENRQKRILQTLQANLEFIGKTKFKTDLFSFNVQKNGGLQPMAITGGLTDIPEEFLIPQDPVPDKKAIREYLKENSASWAHLEPYGRTLRIR